VRVVADDLGTPVRVPDPPAAIVSLVPSLTESVQATLPGVLVGATDYCVHPPDLVTARIGGSKYPRIDDVLALAPGLVLANVEENRQADVARLREHGVPVWVTAAPADVPAALRSLRRLCAAVLGVPAPDWLRAAEQSWAAADPVRVTAIVPVWRRPWVVLGRDTFAGDVLRRVGVGNAFHADPQRYPRPPVDDLLARLADGRADCVVLPDEPYRFTADDGPDAFGGAPFALVPGRHLTWWGPSLGTAREVLATACAALGR
jgi:ABC-type Fe3+-hydroxamate transport system substrate-binding protein